MADGVRLDVAMVERGLARSRSLARKLVEDGLVQVAGKPAGKASQMVPADAEITMTEHVQWASRAAFKLLGALDSLGWERVPERVLDAGASTGGFTEVLLSRGALQVYAVDVGHGQLVDGLRTDPRVVVREGLNLRDLSVADLGNRPVDLVVCDVSFISLKLLLEPLFGALAPAGRALLMVKPQFEVGRKNLTSTGVVRDEQLRLAAVDDVVAHAADLGWRAVWREPSQLPGPAGNIEYFVLFERSQGD
ncbi:MULTISPECIES: TlyA family RNA methyltransferase [unclassified Luteococcus]|uniref:TlyA family RNA methyltransferase n=1 Tax=unclassified Luteococcus TaxID=2639923 RepID=UPI00313B885F